MPDGGVPGDGDAQANYRTVALIVASALFMEHMDATVLTTALPTMARDFGAPVTTLSSALTSYLLGLAIFIPASGRLADRFGAKTVFRLAIILFLIGSVLCSFATTVPVLIAARFIQGVGGAMMSPIGRLVLLRSVAKENLIRAMTWLVMPAMIGPIIGPPLGGFIVTYLDWRWIFYINVPVGLVGIVLVTRFIAEVREENPPPPDWIGFVLTGASLSCLLFGCETIVRPGETVRGLVLLGAGAAAGALYLVHARRKPDPIVDLTLMAIPTFRLSVIAGSLTRITQGAQPFLLPLMMQLGFGMTAAKSGSITLATTLGAFTMRWLAPRVLERFSFRKVLIINGLVACAGYAVCGLFRPGWPLAAIFAVLLVNGFLMSFQFSVYNAIAYDEIPPSRISAATSFYTTLQQMMLSIGICAGAGALQLGMHLGGRATPALGDFSLAFWMVTVVSASATFWNMRFSNEAGEAMRVPRPRKR